MEPCVSKKTSMISFGDPSPGGAKAWTTLTNHFGALRSVLLRVGPSEFALPASIAIEVSLRGFAGRLALPECPQPSGNRLSPWQASWLVVRTFVLFREESSGHTYCVGATKSRRGTPVHPDYGGRKEWRTTEHQWTLRIVIFRRISAASMSDNRHWTKSRWRRRQPTLRDEHVEKKW